ncbi:hypothetical protein ACIGZI_34045 [Streptomyces griseus]|uniref:hypothetical protein n=1 Tax=Streptomyces griseus TaxID=1911 RepID=UPI0037D840D6
MTVIVGLATKHRVHLGADSAGVSGLQLTVRADPKTFRNGQYVMGFTTSFRMGQLLRYSFHAPPAPPTADDLHGFMVTTWTNDLRTCLKDGGWARRDSDQEQAGTFLVGVHGRLFSIWDDYQVAEHADGYAAVGCGDDLALGALHATAHLGMAPRARLTAALAAADHHSAGVTGPYTYASTPKNTKKK